MKTFFDNCEKAEQVYRAINHGVRQQILNTLKEQPKTVTDLYVQLRMDPAVTSMHLRILREAKLVTATREGKHKLYSYSAERLADVDTANLSLGFLSSALETNSLDGKG